MLKSFLFVNSNQNLLWKIKKNKLNILSIVLKNLAKILKQKQYYLLNNIKLSVNVLKLIVLGIKFLDWFHWLHDSYFFLQLVKKYHKATTISKPNSFPHIYLNGYDVKNDND